ncbi:hypothetical protein LBMAG42_34590 [Deltaproteobacteria bacterium]|nr:hypothetical protein LBMAG42_34590 [Deltaproteobacteria bacterium]
MAAHPPLPGRSVSLNPAKAESPPRWRSGAVAVALHLTLALIVTTPVIGTGMVGHPEVDVWNHAWGLWWFWDCFTHVRAPLYTTVLNAPAGGWLWFIDPIGAAFGMWWVPLVGLTAAWNLTLVALVTAASVAGAQLADAVGAGLRSRWIGAVGVAASAHVVSELHNGISEAVGVAWGVFALAALLRALANPERARGWVVTGLLGGLTLLGTYYYALSLALVAIAILLDALRTTPRRLLLRGVLLGAIPAACIAIPVVLLIHHTVADGETAIIPRQSGTWQERFWALEHNAVDPLSLVVPGNFQSVDLAALGESFRHSSYLGWLVLVPAWFAARRRLLWVAAVPLVLSLGPYLWCGGGWVELAGRRFALPYRLLLEVMPAEAIAHPQRIGFLGMALIAALGASAVSERWAPWVAGGLLVELLLVSPAPWPIAKTGELDTSYAEFIAAAEPEPTVRGAPLVVDIPAEAPGNGMASSRYLVFQAVHGRPIPYGPNVRKDCFRAFKSQAATAIVLGDPALLASMTSADFHRGELGWIALHTDLGDPDAGGTAALEARLRELLGAPRELGPVRLWDVRGLQPAAE